MVTLRPYQEAALQDVVSAVQRQQNVLLQAATGAGKTILFSALIQAFMSKYRMRILVMAHRETLIRQAVDKLLHVWPEGEDKVGTACSSVGPVALDRPVIVGSPQTLANRLDALPPMHLVIVDECHRLPPKGKGGQYCDILNALLEKYAGLRMLGVTATPYRLKHGYIYGSECARPEENWFPDMCSSIGIATLQEQGFLCPLTIWTDEAPDLEDVQVSRTGDYDMNALTETMARPVHLDSAVKAFQKYAADRRHVVVFAVTIQHAELLEKRFRKAGYSVGIVHSKLPHDERMRTLEAFDKGDLRFIVNVGVLTEGWDSTAIDCILLCRPTKSTALYVQMVGRGLRIHEGKKDCLLLDLSGNYLEHGDVRDPVVEWRKPTGRQALDVPAEDGNPLVCDDCGGEVRPRDILCPHCGAELKPAVYECPSLSLVDYQAVSWPRKLWLDGRPMLNPKFLTAKGDEMFQIRMQCSDETGTYKVTTYLDLEGRASAYGQKKAREVWWSLANTPPPDTLDEAMDRIGELHFPRRVLVEKNGRFFNVKRWYKYEVA